MATATWTDLVVPAGQVFTYTVNTDNYYTAALLMGGDGDTAAAVEPSIYIYGTVQLADPVNYNFECMFVFTTILPWTHATIQNYGTITIDFPNSAESRAFSAVDESPDLINAGTIYVRGLHDAQAYWTGGSPDITNTGTGVIHVVAEQSAVALSFYHGSGTITNAGQIIAESTKIAPGAWDAATGIVVGTSGFGSLHLVNSGLIQATDIDPANLSRAIDLGNQSAGSIENYGTIRGEYVIFENTWNPAPPFGFVMVHNTGTMDGKIHLDGSNDVVVNEGTITGSISLGLGADVYIGITSVSADVVDGGAGDDFLFGRAGNTFTGGAGRDFFAFASSQGAATITDFTSGTDIIDLRRFAPISVAIQGSDVTATNASGTLVIHASGAVAASDVLTSGGSTSGTSADDILVAGLNAATMSGGDGNDLLVGSDQGDTLDGGAGIDRMVGGAGDDLYVVTDPGDTVVELPGGGIDEIREDGPAWVTLPANVERLTMTGLWAINGWGNELDNVIVGNAASNVLSGGDGNDTIYGGPSDGADTLDGGTGADILVGGTGNDRYLVDQQGDVITENAGEGEDMAILRASYTLGGGVSVEVMTTVNASATTAINLVGNELAQSLYGNAGNNILMGNGGVDYLAGGAGNDTYYVDISDTIAESVGGGDDMVVVPVSYTLASGIEIETLVAWLQDSTDPVNLTGNEFGQSLYGSQGVNSLNGGAGNDYLVGLGGNDFLLGGAGNDNMAGGQGNDIYYVQDSGDQIFENAGEGDDLAVCFASFTLGAGQSVETLSANEGSGAISLSGNALGQSIYGNSAANVLTSGGGADYLVGGAGNDTFVLTNAAGIATVADYTAGDVVDLSQYLSVANGTNIVTGGYVRITAAGQLQVDANGGGDAFVTVGNVSGSGSVTIRYLADGNATDLSVARSASQSMMITKDAAGNTAQHDQAFSPIAIDGGHAFATATIDPFALDTMVTHIDLLILA